MRLDVQTKNRVKKQKLLTKQTKDKLFIHQSQVLVIVM